MHNPAGFEAWRLRGEEISKEIEEERLARRLLAADRKDGRRSALVGRAAGRLRNALRSPMAKGT